jgi:hypothetical protein
MASKTFPGVTDEIWACVKSSSAKDNGTVYDPPDANQGTATTKTIVGTVVLKFDFEPADTSVTYEIVSKPFIVTADEIWNGIQSNINSCKSSSDADADSDSD